MASTLLASVFRPQLLARLTNGQRSYASLGLKPTFLSLRASQHAGRAPSISLALSRQRVNGPLKWGGISFASPGQRRWLSVSRQSLRHHVQPSYGRKPKPLFGFLNRIPENALFVGIIGVNSIVFLMWYLAIAKYKQDRDPAPVIWMQQNFTTSWNNVTSGRIWTPLTSCFSHQDLSHILLNGFTFFFMARPVLGMLGSRQFLFLYLGGGLISSFASLAYSKVAGRNNYSSHGASGAIFSITTLLACVAPTMKFHLYGIIPIPAWLVVSGLFGYDLYATLSNQSGTTDTVGHIGGVIAGVLYFVAKKYRVF